MKSKNWTIKSKIREAFNIRVLRNFEGLWSEEPRIQVYLSGLAHPLSTIHYGYIGAETKNPQLKEAADILSNAVAQWHAALPESIKSRTNFSPMRDNSADSLCAILATKPNSAPGMFHKFRMNRAAEDLTKRIADAMTSIEAAIERHQTIPLTCPDDDIKRALNRALVSVSRHPNICATSIAQKVAENSAPEDPTFN